jgi:enoyl-CoA hydratase/carnithine racemase
MDLRAFQQRSEAATPLDTRAQRNQAAPHPLASFSKPIIAAVNGLAYGGGLEICLLCDIVVAAERARFAAAEVTRGLMPGNGATQRLPRKIGVTHALEMLLTGQPIDSAKALRIGLVNDVLPDDGLLAGATQIAAAIAANGPVAVRLIKEAATRGIEMPLAQGLQLETDLLALVQGTADAKEGVRAFLEKRKPKWVGQ